jgi:hypothetical protein
MPKKQRKYAKPLSMFPLTPEQALANILSIPAKDAERIRNVSAVKLRKWRGVKKKKG